MYYVLFTVVVFLLLCGSNGTDHGFKIFRSEHDIFTNLQCSGNECTESHCKIYDAECVSDENCKYCICNKSKMNTFIRNETDPTKGRCKSDEQIVPESVPDERFLIQKQGDDRCIKAQQGGHVKGTSCSSPTHDMFWIWTGTEDKLLMNIQTLKCMQGQGIMRPAGSYKSDRPDNVSMQPCQENFNLQKMTCLSKGQMTIGWNRWVRSDRDVESRRFLHLNVENHAVAKIDTDQIWNSNKKQPCGTETTYTGCYRFSDGSFMKYLDYDETNPKQQISAPIFNKNDYGCKVKPHFQHIRDGQKWKPNNIFSIENKYNGEKFITTEHLKAWSGSLLKLFVKCGEEEHCVLLKLESYPRYLDETNNLPSPSESSGTNSSSIAIAVTVTLLVVLLLALGCFVYYRRRKREQMSQNNNNDLGAVDCSGPSCEDPNRVTETLKENGHEVPGNEQGTTSNTYSYPYSGIIRKPPSTEHEYTYASDTNIPRKTDGRKSEKGEPSDGGAMYHTLEQPGQPSDGNFYNYPDARNIAKPPSPKVEYTYAKDTDIPRATADNTVVPEKPTSNPVYHTLEQDPPTTDVYKYPGSNNPTELEYPYAKDTDIPRTNGNSTPPCNSALYHTLEEQNPPQPPAYSTLEGPED